MGYWWFCHKPVSRQKLAKSIASQLARSNMNKNIEQALGKM